MKKYEFTITIVGDGDCPQDAWEDACDAFSLDYGEFPEDHKSYHICRWCGNEFSPEESEHKQLCSDSCFHKEQSCQQNKASPVFRPGYLDYSGKYRLLTCQRGSN